MRVKVDDIVCISTYMYGGMEDKIGLVLEKILPYNDDNNIILVRVEQEYGLADLIFISTHDTITVIGEL